MFMNDENMFDHYYYIHVALTVKTQNTDAALYFVASSFFQMILRIDTYIHFGVSSVTPNLARVFVETGNGHLLVLIARAHANCLIHTC